MSIFIGLLIFFLGEYFLFHMSICILAMLLVVHRCHRGFGQGATPSSPQHQLWNHWCRIWCTEMRHVKILKKETTRWIIFIPPFLGKFCPGKGGQPLIYTKFWKSSDQTSIPLDERTNERTMFVQSDRGFESWLNNSAA